MSERAHKGAAIEITLPVRRTRFRGVAPALQREYDPGRRFGRSCGSCTMCCRTAPIVDDMIGVKPPGEPCRHLCGTGCSVYAERPAICRSFACNWLMGHGDVDQRPDRMGAMPVVAEDRQQCIMYLAPGATPATMSKAARRYARSWLKRIGSAVLYLWGDGYGTVTAVWPDGYTVTEPTTYSYPGGHDGKDVGATEDSGGVDRATE